MAMADSAKGSLVNQWCSWDCSEPFALETVQTEDRSSCTAPPTLHFHSHDASTTQPRVPVVWWKILHFLLGKIISPVLFSIQLLSYNSFSFLSFIPLFPFSDFLAMYFLWDLALFCQIAQTHLFLKKSVSDSDFWVAWVSACVWFSVFRTVEGNRLLLEKAYFIWVHCFLLYLVFYAYFWLSPFPSPFLALLVTYMVRERLEGNN